MPDKEAKNRIITILLLLSLLFAPINILAEDIFQPGGCLDKAMKRMHSLPELQYLKMLDGQIILLDEFRYECQKNWQM